MANEKETVQQEPKRDYLYIGSPSALKADLERILALWEDRLDELNEQDD